MVINVAITGYPAGGPVIFGYTPVEVVVTISNRPIGPIRVTITSTGPKAQLSFYARAASPPVNSLTLTIPAASNTVTFFVGGRFGSRSSNLNDGTIRIAADSVPPSPVNAAQQAIPVTVRVRLNANQMTTVERDRFLTAYARVNNAGLGIYQALRDMHTGVSSNTIHFGPQFLPWHRAFILQLERELQAQDPLVCLPYWNFNQSAPKLFTVDFMGATTVQSPMQLAPTNPLITWVTDNAPLWARRRQSFPPPIQSEAATLALGSTLNAFSAMEGDPHGSAHVQFQGPISNIGMAVRDPLFFLLHCNVDRLWALWQLNNKRYNPAQASSYPNQGLSPGVGPTPTRTLDTMWPWDGVIVGNRPPTAPGGQFPASPHLAFPGLKPTIGSMVDYQGKVNRANVLGFDYDNVPY